MVHRPKYAHFNNTYTKVHWINLFSDDDLSTAKSFLQCLGLWTGKKSTFNQLQKKYVIPLKGNSARRLENISKSGLRKSFSLNSLDKLYINDNHENEPENDQENIRETENEKAENEKAGKLDDLVNNDENENKNDEDMATDEPAGKIEEQKSFDDSIKSFELELGEDHVIKDDSKSENEPDQEPEKESENSPNLDDSLEDGEIVEDEVEGQIKKTVEEDVPSESDKAVEMIEDKTAVSSVTAVLPMITLDTKAKVEPEAEPKKKMKKIETKWPKIEKVERRKSLDCLELLAKEMISNDFLKTARAIMKMKKEEPVCPVKKEEFQPRSQEYKIEISKKESVRNSPKSSKPFQSRSGINAPELVTRRIKWSSAVPEGPSTGKTKHQIYLKLKERSGAGPQFLRLCHTRTATDPYRTKSKNIRPYWARTAKITKPRPVPHQDQ